MSRLIVISSGVQGAAPELIERARKIAPEHEILDSPSEAALEPRIAEVEVAFSGLPAALVPRAVSLRWVQLSGAGAEGALARYRDPKVLLTNASGVHAVPITEHVLAFLFAFARGLHHSIRAQAKREWLKHTSHRVFELREKRMLIVGVGAIGGELARSASALGMSVVGVRRTASTAGLPGAERVVGPERLDAELQEADFVVLTVPLTERTRGMFGSREIGLMKRSAYLVNIGRGKTIREADLVRALAEGRIAGAGLDVFEEEPLPKESPLWGMENVIVSAHYSGGTPRYGERLWEIFLDNLGSHVRGLPLRNVVDREAGY